MSMEIFGVFLAVAKELQNTPKLQFLSYPGTVLGAGGGDGGGQDCVEFQPGSGYLSKCHFQGDGEESQLSCCELPL